LCQSYTSHSCRSRDFATKTWRSFLANHCVESSKPWICLFPVLKLGRATEEEISSIFLQRKTWDFPFRLILQQFFLQTPSFPIRLVPLLTLLFSDTIICCHTYGCGLLRRFSDKTIFDQVS
jgi:hypothetical protein